MYINMMQMCAEIASVVGHVTNCKTRIQYIRLGSSVWESGTHTPEASDSKVEIKQPGQELERVRGPAPTIGPRAQGHIGSPGLPPHSLGLYDWRSYCNIHERDLLLSLLPLKQCTVVTLNILRI